MRTYIYLTILLSCLYIAARGQTITNLDDLDLSGLPQPTTAKALHYWFDDDNGDVKAATGISGTYILDASQLIDGLHTLHYQVMGSNDVLAYVGARLFLKAGSSFEAENVKAQELMYWFDDDTAMQQGNISEGAQLIDASTLIEGLHTLHYQVLCNNGQMTPTMSTLFLRVNADAETVMAKNLRYWFDDNAATVTTTSVVGGTQTLDVTTLSTGLHTLNYQLIDSQGRVTSPVTRLFLKNFNRVMADGHNLVTKYQYWLNTNSQTMQTVELNTAVNPYTLITLLPLQKESIHSDCFHFEITNDVPTIYAKNIFHIRFHDAQGYFSDGEKAFVDYSVRQEVTDVELLEPNIPATINKPAENAIKWYKLTALRGDSLSFKTNIPCTIQLFSPSGSEVYNAYGSNAVSFGGAYAPEDGLYFLALHDVTAQRNTKLTIDYNHIDKYALLSYTPKEFGVAESIVEMHIDGNGYEKLEKALLYNGQQAIRADSIVLQSRSRAQLHFMINGNEPIGKYSMKLVFVDGEQKDSIVIENAINLREAVLGDVLVEISPSRTIGLPFPITLSVTNTGNQALLYVPLNIAYDNIDKIAEVHFENFYIESSLGLDYLLQCDSTAEKIGFSPMIHTNNFLGEQKDANVLNLLIPYLAPYEKKDFVVSFVTSDGRRQNFNLYAWAGEALNVPYNGERSTTNIPSVRDYLAIYDEYKNEESFMRKTGRRASQETLDRYDAILDRTNNTLGAADNALDIAQRLRNSTIAGIAQNAIGAVSNAIDVGRTIGFVSNSMDHNHDLELIRMGAIPMGDEYTDEMIRNLHGVNSIEQVANNHPILFALFGLRNCQDHDPQIDNPHPNAHYIEILNSCEPNDMLGYKAESGSKAVKDGVTEVYYTIQFENDTVFANAPAHDIYLTDTLDLNLFDLSTYRPTKIKIGEKSMNLTGERNFISTLDMRPEIYAIAQIEGTIEDNTGIVRWHISSLDPMTMEPIQDAMVGVLPVNFDGSGMGEASFDISLKDDLPHGTVIRNRSGNIFDRNETVMTPIWTNVIDRIAPESHIADLKMMNDSTATVSIEATDELSGPWRYDVYVHYGEGSAWCKAAENVPADTTASVKIYEGIDHGFYVVVTDSAGNIEQKNAEREFTLEVFGSQVDTNTKLALAEGWNWISHNQQSPLSADALKPASTRMLGQTEELIDDPLFGWTGGLDELLPTKMYKIHVKNPKTIQLSGRLFSSVFRSIHLNRGWNWLGYPVANVMTPAEAFAKLEVEEGDMLIGQDGLTVYNDGQWMGTLTEMAPGLGYLYHSVSAKNLFYNASAQASSRKANVQRFKSIVQYPEGWSVNKRMYPNVMGVIAILTQDNNAVEPNNWIIGAFTGSECRGISSYVSGLIMMNVYGQGGEPITFYALNVETGEVLPVAERESFAANVIGTIQQPYQLHIGESTGISGNLREMMRNQESLYDLHGRKVEGTQLRNGIYVTKDKNNSKTQKVIRK